MSPKVTNLYKDQKRQRILEAAKKVFVRNGFNSVTMKDIVNESGFSRGGVYLYYSSPEEIFLSLIELSDSSYLSLINRLNCENKTAWEGLVELIEFVKQEMSSIKEGLAPALYEYFLSVNRREHVYELLTKRFKKAISTLNNLFDKGIRNAEFHPIFSIGDISKFLVFFMDGLAVNIIHLGALNIDLESQTAQLISYLKKSLQVQSNEVIKIE